MKFSTMARLVERRPWILAVWNRSKSILRIGDTREHHRRMCDAHRDALGECFRSGAVRNVAAHEHEPLTELLVTKAKTAVRAEVWGELYAKDHLGIHQIHCRRASCAVTTDLKGRDGALKLYYADNTSELFLFKFCGQP